MDWGHNNNQTDMCGMECGQMWNGLGTQYQTDMWNGMWTDVEWTGDMVVPTGVEWN